MSDSIHIFSISVKLKQRKKNVPFLLTPVVPMPSWTAWRICAAPIHSEPPWLCHQIFPQTECGEVWLALHPALLLFCINYPQPCGLPYLHQWVRNTYSQPSLVHPIWYLPLKCPLPQVSGSWIHVCVFCGAVPAVARDQPRVEGWEAPGSGSRGRRRHRGDGSSFQWGLCNWGLTAHEVASTEEELQVSCKSQDR